MYSMQCLAVRTKTKVNVIIPLVTIDAPDKLSTIFILAIVIDFQTWVCAFSMTCIGMICFTQV